MSINPSTHTIDYIFGNTKYYIDFYQRDYKWKKTHVQSLLDDIFYKFENEYKDEIDINLDSISKFGWYYLNNYVTNTYNGKLFIVDGQQRFTTITLILIKLYNMAKWFSLDNRTEWLTNKIYGMGAEGKSFWMGENNRTEALEDLYTYGKKTVELKYNDISIRNIYQNYSYIEDYLSSHLDNKHKFEAFIIYYLTRILLVEIHIADYKDVSMVFEVINDRGESLKPYEVFKGALLGQLDKSEIDKYYNIWTENIHKLQSIDEKEIDSFFRYYFRSKFVDTRNDYSAFDGEYHKTVFSSKWQSKFNLKRNPKEVKRFIQDDFNYFSKLYIKLLENTDYDKNEYLFYNSLNEQDRQYLLVLSSVDKGDLEENEKITLVTKLFDRHFTLLQLLGCYDSSYNFAESIMSLNHGIRNKCLVDIKDYFDKQLIEDINNAKNIKIDDPFQWSLFKEANNNLGTRFIRYFYARIDHFISVEASLQTATYRNLVTNTGHVHGYHIEHILADNNENRAIFNNDEELFYKERNKLGALALLKGRDNQSSGNETYNNKLKTYSHGTLWAQTLTDDFYHSNKGFQDFILKYNLNFRPINKFDSIAIEERQKLLFEMVKIIWG